MKKLLELILLFVYLTTTVPANTVMHGKIRSTSDGISDEVMTHLSKQNLQRKQRMQQKVSNHSVKTISAYDNTGDNNKNNDKLSMNKCHIKNRFT